MATNANVAKRGGIRFRTDGTSDLQRALNFTPSAAKAYWVEYKAVAFRTQNDAEAASYWRQAIFRVSALGVVTLVGAIRTVVTDNEDSAGWQFVLGTDGTTVTLDVASEGSPGDWVIFTDIFEIDIVNTL
jgi:hypothetical protein